MKLLLLLDNLSKLPLAQEAILILQWRWAKCPIVVEEINILIPKFYFYTLY